MSWVRGAYLVFANLTGDGQLTANLNSQIAISATFAGSGRMFAVGTGGHQLMMLVT